MKSFITIIFIAVTLLISGCETFHGLGRDVEKAGTWIKEKAQ